MKKNHLIVMPRFVDKIGEWYNFPLGIPYVSSSMKKAGINVDTLNLNHVDGDVEHILREEIINNNIEILSTGGLTAQYNAINTVIQAAKKIRPNIITVVGGGIITASPEPAMIALESADFGVIGEGEITNVELAIALETGTNLENVDGIIFRKDHGFHLTKQRAEIENLDQIPFPDYKGFGFDYIINSVASLVGMNETNTITMISSRSCPFNCTFCFHSSGKKYRQRSLDNFFEELDFLVSEYGVKYIFIADELFSYDKERVKEFCERIKNYNIRWSANFRVTDITEELVVLTKKSNCAIMGFGLESADNSILKSMKKAITIEQIEHALKIVYDANMTLQGNFIFGDVKETKETATNTLNWWKKHPEYGITLNFITVYPGTPLYKHALEKGIIKDEVEFIKKACPPINVSQLSKSEIAWLSQQIVTLPQQELKPPNDMSHIEIDYKEKRISLVGHCVRCETENKWEDIRFFTRNVLCCSNCGVQHKIPVIPEVVTRFDEELVKIIHEGNKIAIWGINDYVYEFLKNSNVLDHPNIFLIDISEMKQGTLLGNKTIYAPKIISDENISVVVVGVLSFFSSIKKEVENTYVGVDRILNILELIK